MLSGHILICFPIIFANSLLCIIFIFLAHFKTGRQLRIVTDVGWQPRQISAMQSLLKALVGRADINRPNAFLQIPRHFFGLREPYGFAKMPTIRTMTKNKIKRQDMAIKKCKMSPKCNRKINTYSHTKEQSHVV